MRYDYLCQGCGTVREYEAAVAERDAQRCRGCEGPVERLFSPASVCLPERFTKHMRSQLEPTYAECLEVDRRNDDYLKNKPRLPPKPTFEVILDKECQERKVEPSKLYQYRLNDAFAR